MTTSHTDTASTMPPMVKGLPFLGITLQAIRDVTSLLVTAYHEHGPVFRMSRLGKEVVVLAGVEANNFYVENEETHFYTQDVYKHLCAEGGTAYNFIALEGEAHSHLRQQMRLGYSRQLIANQVLPMLDYAEQTAQTWQPGQTLDVLETMSNLLMEQAGTSLLNHSLADEDFAKLNTFCKTFVGVGGRYSTPCFVAPASVSTVEASLYGDYGWAFAAHVGVGNGRRRPFDQTGEYFGEIGLLQNRPRTATVRAAPDDEVEALAMEREAFVALLSDSESTEINIARTIAQRLVNLEQPI